MRGRMEKTPAPLPIGEDGKKIRGRFPVKEGPRVTSSPYGANGRCKLAPATATSAASVHADGLKLVAPCIGDRRFAAVGQHDRGAVGGMQREQFQAWRDLRRRRKR